MVNIPNKTFFNWSIGKDSAMALHRLFSDVRYDVRHLLTTVNGFHNRVSMHGVRTELLHAQIKAIGLPHTEISLPQSPTNEEYEQLMMGEVGRLKGDGFTHAAFGDIYLEDLRRYREQQLERVGLSAVFPLWGEDTRDLLSYFVESGFRAVVVCVNDAFLDKSFAGRHLDASFFSDLPAGVDPCGENGEFHTFCYAAPFFSEEIAFKMGEIVCREYDNAGEKSAFWFADLIPLG
ncbi:MAG: diphthine--ammonia ligase [Taibaiella sp.]|nr:diphthine--ammonia ligase [Taibaiella sp.]